MWALEGSELLMAGLAGKRPVCGSPGWASSPDWGERSRALSGLGGDRALGDLLAWSCQELDGGPGDQQRQGQADDDLAGGPVPEHQGQAGQRDRDDPQCPPVGVDPGPDGAGVRKPAPSAPRRSQPMAPATPLRARVAVTDWPVRNAPAATTSPSTKTVRSPARRNRRMVSYRTAAASCGSTSAGTAARETDLETARAGGSNNIAPA